METQNGYGVEFIELADHGLSQLNSKDSPPAIFYAKPGGVHGL